MNQMYRDDSGLRSSSVVDNVYLETRRDGTAEREGWKREERRASERERQGELKKQRERKRESERESEGGTERDRKRSREIERK